MNFLIGQRVIYSNREIVVVITAPKGKPCDQWSQWVRRVDGIEQCVALDNLKPLPNGQL